MHLRVQRILFRLPHIVGDRVELYEDLFRLLEELELLVRIWRRRTEHPYTAHLRSESKEWDFSQWSTSNYDSK